MDVALFVPKPDSNLDPVAGRGLLMGDRIVGELLRAGLARLLLGLRGISTWRHWRPPSTFSVRCASTR
jgi:hypothetical protein